MPKPSETFQCSVCCPTTTTTTAAPTTTANPNTTTTNPNTTTTNPNTTTTNPNTTTVGPEVSTTPQPCACCSKGGCKCKEGTVDAADVNFSLSNDFLIFVHRPYPIPAHQAVWSKIYGQFTAPDMIETDKGPYGNVMDDGRKRLLYKGTINESFGEINSGTLYSYKAAAGQKNMFVVDDWNGSTDGNNSIQSSTWIEIKEDNSGLNCSLYARPKRTYGNLPVFDDVEWVKIYSRKKTDKQDGPIIISLPSEWFCCGVTGVDLKLNVCTKNICLDNPILQYECTGQASWITNSTVFSNQPECSVHGKAHVKITYIDIQGGVETVRSNVEYDENCIFGFTSCPVNNIAYGQRAVTFGNFYKCVCLTYEDPNFRQGTFSEFIVDNFTSDFNEKNGKITLNGIWTNTLEVSVHKFNYDEFYRYYVVTDRTMLDDPRTEYKQGTITITRL